MNDSINALIHLLQALPPEGMGVLMYIAAMASMIILHRFFGKDGLFLFVVLSVVLGNIQVLKAVKLSFFNYPIAMGSVLFSSSLLAIDSLTEYYGENEAKKGVWLGFAGMVMTSLFMILTLGAKVVEADPNTPLYHFVAVDNAMKLLFAPAPAILLASLFAYLVSQYIDIASFLWIKKQTQGRFLALRTFGSTFLSTLIDNCLFNFLAWQLFFPLDLDFKTFLITYVVGTFVLRILVNFVNTPFIYFMRRKNWMAAR